MTERLYGMQDGNWNKQASTPTDEGGSSASAVETASPYSFCDTTGSVTERYAYSAYGAPVFMTDAKNESLLDCCGPTRVRHTGI